ncbi:MAG: S8 family serine peptidase [Flavobacteriales bacterium]|nr:S8 family serine peptidase [Flavobacteriales bacterium]
MKKLITLFGILFALAAYSQKLTFPSLYSLPEYKSVLTDKLLVSYDVSITETEMKALFSACEGLQTHQTLRPLKPGRWLVTVKKEYGIQKAADELKTKEQINSVTPWLKDSGGNERGVLEELYVKLRASDNLNPEEYLTGLAEDFAATFIGKSPWLPNVYVLRFSKHSLCNALEASILLSDLPQIEFTDVNFAFFPIVNSVNDSLFPRQWSLQNNGNALQWSGTAGADMDVVNAWTLTTGNPSIKIAILDSGVDTLHPDLMPNLLPGFDATGGNSHGYPNLNFPSDGHGTACAGIAAAKGNNQIGVAGVAYDCSIVPVKMFFYVDTSIFIPGFIDTMLYEIPYSETDFMVAGTTWAWQTAGADILSNSWGLPPDLLPFAPVDQFVVMEALNLARAQGRNGKGAIQMFSSGNENAALIWPASLFNNISVGATTNKDKRASFSCYGTGLDLSAPGVQVTTTDMSGNYGYSNGDYYLEFGGTSAACPNAAGVAGLILSLYPDFTFNEVRTLMRVTAERVGGYNYDSTHVAYGTWSPQLGSGRINAHQALLGAPYLSTTSLPEETRSIHLFPNPAKHDIQIMMHGWETGMYPYKLVNIAGIEVGSGNFNIHSNNEFIQTISIEDLKSGIYFLCIWDYIEPVSMKFVKQ